MLSPILQTLPGDAAGVVAVEVAAAFLTRAGCVAARLPGPRARERSP